MGCIRKMFFYYFFYGLSYAHNTFTGNERGDFCPLFKARIKYFAKIIKLFPQKKTGIL